ncbi:VWA domain-containing protein [Metallumcola ferriviriculae]|uniref:VWA domain-containing protein n=1 Tax=Metallumcola ferriviriculae TaxID=3039180 RepID=A0AAU0UJF0_9FIRM|nr:VWA domain-containing protein [Desulfitibacteraceae bacterium MK1]
MAISFDHVWVLPLLPLVWAVLYYLWKKSQVNMGSAKLSLILRYIIVSLIVLALAGVSWNFIVSRQAVTFLADLSDSNKGAVPRMEQFIRDATDAKDTDDQTAVATFGEVPLVDIPMSSEPLFDTIQAIPDSNYTNIGQALQLAAALSSEGFRKRVVLLSDGKENLGDAVEAASLLKKRGIRVDIVPVQTGEVQDARIDKLTVPEVVRAGERIPLTVSIGSNFEGAAEIYIYRDRTLAGKETVQLDKGENQFLFSRVAEESGFYPFRVEVHAAGDKESRNNSGYALTRVTGPPRVLMVSSQSGESALMAALSQQFQVDIRLPGAVPQTEAGLAGYDGIILDNIPAFDLPAAFLDAIKVSVRDLGTGLVMLGGKNSFGVGGYYRTPIEEALPVHMDLRGKKELPSLGLMLVIDKSGSMGGDQYGNAKMELAKEAAIRSTQILMPKDQVGVYAFDDSVYPVVELGPVTDARKIQQRIASIGANGGTNIYPALALAMEKLAEAETKLKHIILLTDGRSATGGSYQALTDRMKEKNITLTTVAVGNDADAQLLSTLAEWGQGRYYFTADAASIPKIFTKETMLVSRSYLIEERFTPRVTALSPIMEGIEGLPELGGYVAASAKQTATVVLSSHKQDPVLATWQFGLGRSLAWTSDAGGPWSKAWSDFDNILAKMVAWTLPRHHESDLLVNTDFSGEEGMVSVDTPRQLLTSKAFSANFIGPRGDEGEVELNQVGPGQYRGNFPVSQSGVYLLKVVDKSDDGQALSTVGLVVPYSPEYGQTTDGRGILEAVASAGGGTLLSLPEAAFADNLPPVSGRYPLWPYLLAVAAVLWPIDIAVRRLTLDGLLKRLVGFFKAKPAGVPETGNIEILSRLKMNKDRVREEQKRWSEDNAPDGAVRPMKDTKAETEIPTGKRPPEHPRRVNETADNKSTNDNSYTSRLLDAKRRAHDGDKR